VVQKLYTTETPINTGEYARYGISEETGRNFRGLKLLETAQKSRLGPLCFPQDIRLEVDCSDGDLGFQDLEGRVGGGFTDQIRNFGG
jgi:hypothetical protein